MLRSVTPTDFEGFSSEVVDIATTVSLDYGNGQTETYTNYIRLFTTDWYKSTNIYGGKMGRYVC